MNDKVNHPNHYQHGRIEVAVAVDLLCGPDGWLKESLQYACRAPHKGSEKEDVLKAIWCWQRAFQYNCLADWQGAMTNPRERLMLAEALVEGVPDTEHYRLLRSFVRQLVVRPADVSDKGTIQQLEKFYLSMTDAGDMKPKVTIGPFRLAVAMREFRAMAGLGVNDKPTWMRPDDVRTHLLVITEEFCEILMALGYPDFAHSIMSAARTLPERSVSTQAVMTKLADAIGDTMYTLSGFMAHLGLPEEDILAEIHRSNMTKRGGHVDEHGKLCKPSTYNPPNLAPLTEVK